MSPGRHDFAGHPSKGRRDGDPAPAGQRAARAVLCCVSSNQRLSIVGILIATLFPALLYAAGSQWSATGSMTMPREAATATLLPGGTVLVAGGNNGLPTAAAEVYDPGAGTFRATGAMAMPRENHSATLLANGDVLVAGGCCTPHSTTALASAELYDPRTGTWSPTGSMHVARESHTATLLPSGRVLVAGGIGANGADLSSAEVYNPQTGTWTLTGSMSVGREYHVAALLATGNVLVAGGYDYTGHHGTLASAEVYNPQTGTWTLTGSLHTARKYATATRLADGRVLVTGGYTYVLIFGRTLSSAEVYDPATGVFTATGSMTTPREYHSAALLRSGKVLVTGGIDAATGALASAEVYDPATGVFTATQGAMSSARYYHVTVALPGGGALVAGGVDASGFPTAGAERYTPGARWAR